MHGYYSQDIKFKNGTRIENAKIIGLNLNVCYIFNFATWGHIFTDWGK